MLENLKINSTLLGYPYAARHIENSDQVCCMACVASTAYRTSLPIVVLLNWTKSDNSRRQLPEGRKNLDKAHATDH